MAGELKVSYGLFTSKGLEWLRSLQLDAVDSYLPVIQTLTIQVGKLSRELRGMASGDEDVKLLMTIPGIGYYSALLSSRRQAASTGSLTVRSSVATLRTSLQHRL